MRRQELCDAGLGPERRDQLEVTVTDVEQRRLDALVGDGLAVDQREPEHLLVEGQRVVNVSNRYAGVVDGFEHPHLNLA